MLKRISVESILVMFLFIIFTASIGLLIVEGQEAYQTIISNKNANEDVRIGVSFINMKVKQNNISGHIQVVDNPYNDNKALLVNHYGQEAEYATYIFCEEGILYECYVLESDPIDINLSEEIVSLEYNIAFEEDASYDLIHVLYDGIHHLALNVSSEEADYEE